MRRSAAPRGRRCRTVADVVARFGPSAPPKPFTFKIGDRVRHVSGEAGTVVGSCSEFYSTNRSDFYRVRTDRGITELFPEVTIVLVSA